MSGALLNRPESEKEKMEEFLEFCEEESEEETESEEEEEEEEEEFLFPRELDLTEVCSCHECCTKINALKDFEKELISKKKLIEDCWIHKIRSEDRCRKLAETIRDLVNLFELLHVNLKKVHEDFGFPSIFEECDCNWVSRRKNVECDCKWVNELKNIYLSMNIRLFGKEEGEKIMKYMLLGDKVYGKKGTYGEGGTDEKVRMFRTDTIRREIDFLLFLYKRTRKRDEAVELLNKILEIENQHERDRKFTEELDPSIYKRHIENQIELLKKLPFEEVEREMKEVLDTISPYEENEARLGEVRIGISKTRNQMFQTSREFLKKKTNNGNVKGHGLSGLETTLDSLINQMKLFNDQWNKEYAPSNAQIITLCQQTKVQGICLQGLCPPPCQDECLRCDF